MNVNVRGMYPLSAQFGIRAMLQTPTPSPGSDREHSLDCRPRRQLHRSCNAYTVSKGAVMALTKQTRGQLRRRRDSL